MSNPKEKFEAAVRKGLGRAALLIKADGGAPYREPLARACVEDQRYDSQLEEMRGPYLLELIRLTGDAAWHAERIEGTLRDYEGSWHAGQVFTLAAGLVDHAGVRSAMYECFERLGVDELGIWAAEAIVGLDGVSGLLFVCRSFAGIAAKDRPWMFDCLMEALEKREPVSELPEPLDRWLQECRAARESSPGSRQEHPCGLDDVYRLLAEKRNKGLLAYWSRETATDEELEHIVAHGPWDGDVEVLRNLVYMFNERKYPGPPERLLRLARVADERLARNSAMALARMTHPAIRTLALEWMHLPERKRFGIAMLGRNQEAGDHRLVERLLREAMTPEEAHDAVFGAREFVQARRSPDSAILLRLMYEVTPCSRCRYWTVESLISLDRLPDQLRAECAYDADPDTRALVNPLIGA